MASKFAFALLLLLHLSRAVTAQTSYSGTIGSFPIELTLSEGADDGVYTYTRFDTPIYLVSTLKKGLLTLTEKDAYNKATAILTLPTFDIAQKTTTGTWKNLATGQELPLMLTKNFTVSVEIETAEVMQVPGLKNSYFKAVFTKGGFSGTIKLFEKRTDRLLQQFSVESQPRGIHCVSSVDDFNFDGHEDFSVFESSYAGPNTSQLYFLYNPKTKRYFESGFSGVSLEFDSKAKRITETNSCCAGSSVTTAIYKVVRNHMVQLEAHCYRWDEKKQKLVERKASACQ